jgi:hypothetical protein
MGCNVCRPSEPEALFKSGMQLNKNEARLKKNNPHKKEDYNNFLLLFENNLQYLGQYITQQDFNSYITPDVQNYMIEHPLNINQELYKESETYEVKPVEFKNGNIYFGNWNENLKMEGRGKYYLKEDRVLAEGYWGNGDLIYSRVFFPNGDIYEGEMKDSTYHGKGKLTSANGDIYEGDFINGEKSGNGKLIFADKTVYEGAFEKGEFKGNGKMKWPNGYEYCGNFEGPKLCGFGVLSNSSRDIYEGDFDNNLFNGKGKYTYENGNVYEGEFQYGVKKGKGVYICLNKFEYDGDWDNDLPCGVGILRNWNKNGVIKSTWRYGKIMEEPVYEKGTAKDFEGIDFNFIPSKMNLKTKELSHLEIIDINSSQYKIGTYPSFLEE